MASPAPKSRAGPHPPLRYAFADLELDPLAGRLLRGGVALDVDPKPLELLTHLIRHRDRVVSREELRETVWSGTAVSEAAIASVVRDLRRALGDDGSQQRLVRTVRGAGFRFVAEVEERRVAPARGAFVGRRALLERIESRLAAVGPEGGEAGRWLWIAGEAGMGKTRLLAEVARRAAGRGVAVHLGGCLEEDGAAPFRPWLQIVRSLMGEGSAEAVEERFGAEVAEVLRLLPEREPGEPPGDAGLAEDPAERWRVFAGVAALLRRAGADGPVALALDDVHRADAATRKLLQHLLGDLPWLPVLVIATYRASEIEAGGPLAAVLGQGAPGVEHATLEGLGEAEAVGLAEAVAGRPLAPGLGRALWRRSQGNPLFVEELARELGAREGADGDLGAESVAAFLPGGIRQALGARLARLPAEVRDVLAAASVLGREFDVDVLVASLDEEAGTAPAALDRALAAGLLEPGEASGRLRFAHILVRDVLYDGIPELRRGALHGRAGRALERLRGGTWRELAAELAHHFSEALIAGEAERAFRYAREAAAHAMQQGAYEAAAALAALAVRASELLPPGAALAETLVVLGDARWCSGETSAAREAFERAASLAREARTPEVFAQAAFGIAGRTDVEPQMNERAVALLDEALAGLPEEDSVLRARILARLGTEHYYSDDAAHREGLTREAVAMAERLGDRATLAYTLSARGFVMFRPDFEPARRLAVYERQIAVCDGRGDIAALGCCEKIVALTELGDGIRADAALVKLERLAREVRQPFYSWRAAVLRAARTFVDGRLEEALAQGQEALALGRGFGSPNAFPSFGGLLLFVRREQGRIGELEPAVRELVKTFELFRSTLPLIHLELGRPREARDVFEQVMARELDDVPRDLHWLPIACWLGATCAPLRDEARARLLHRLLGPMAGRMVVPGHFAAFDGSVDHHLGRLAATFGDLDAADEHFEAAVAFERRAGARLHCARSQRHWAGILWKRGAPREREQARELIAQAAGTYRELGLEKRAVQVEQVTRR